MFGLRNRDMLPDTVLEEFEWLIDKLRAFLSVAHNEDGTLIDTTDSSREAPLTRTTTLINAQILALPTTAVELVPAPVSGYTIVVDRVVLLANFAGGAYSTIDNDAYLTIQYAGGVEWSNYIANIDSESYTQLDVFMDGTAKKYVLREYMDTQDTTLGFGNLAFGYTARTHAGLALQIKVNNLGGGVFTGGHANNVLKVKVFYTIERLP